MEVTPLEMLVAKAKVDSQAECDRHYNVGWVDAVEAAAKIAEGYHMDLRYSDHYISGAMMASAFIALSIRELKKHAEVNK